MTSFILIPLKGSEFLISNKEIYDILIEKYAMVIYTLKAPKKASVVERSIRSLKSRIGRYFTEHKTLRWIDVLQDFTNNLNHTVNRTIGIEPINVNFENRQKIYNRLYGSSAPPIKCRYHINDKVRILEKKHIFSKGYTPNWSKQLYQITKVHNDTKVCFYEIADSTGQKIDKKFYDQE